MAPLVVMASRQRRLAGQHLLAEEVGAHLAEEAVQTIKVHLRSRSMGVSQPLLDADMERYHLHVWEASGARQRSLEPRRMYLPVASAPLPDSF